MKINKLKKLRNILNPVFKKKGSAIFIHVAKKNYIYTKGCIAISKIDFFKILPSINKNTKISIN